MKHYRPTYTTSMEIILFHEILKYSIDLFLQNAQEDDTS